MPTGFAPTPTIEPPNDSDLSKIANSVVKIQRDLPGGVKDFASGTLIGQQGGYNYVVTAGHPFRNDQTSPSVVTFGVDGRVYTSQAELVEYNAEESDYAILKVRIPAGLNPDSVNPVEIIPVDFPQMRLTDCFTIGHRGEAGNHQSQTSKSSNDSALNFCSLVSPLSLVGAEAGFTQSAEEKFI